MSHCSFTHATPASGPGQARKSDRAEVHPDDEDGGGDRFLWLETLLAGVAEDGLSRKYLHVRTHAFRTSW